MDTRSVRADRALLDSRKGELQVATSPANARFINPPTMATPRGYTHVAEITNGRTVYISGQIALDQSGEIVGVGDMRAQAEQVFTNLKAALDAVGTDFAHVVKMTIYTVDIAQIPVIREVRDRYVNIENPPASTAVEIRRLVREEFLVEIEVVAIVPA
jgi:reactive intermediate/imine deaminase